MDRSEGDWQRPKSDEISAAHMHHLMIENARLRALLADAIKDVALLQSLLIQYTKEQFKDDVGRPVD